MADILGPAAAAVLSLAGWVGFIVIFVRHMNVYWFILSPLIIAVYQIPAVAVFGLWKRSRRSRRPDAARENADSNPDSKPGADSSFAGRGDGPES